MLGWALLFLLISLATAFIGFAAGAPTATAGVAQIVCFAFLAIFAFWAIVGVTDRLENRTARPHERTSDSRIGRGRKAP
jgi:uncharacterized membrane protein YtjA (UPF0391 family)